MQAQVLTWIAAYGLLAVFLLMALDAVLPAGGELVMLLGGAVTSGAIAGAHGPTLVGVVAAGTLGYLAGSVVGWAVGRVGGPRLATPRSRWLHLGPERFARAERWFGRYGPAFVLVGRLTPLVRSFVSIPAGALAFPFGPYVALSAVASLIWCIAFGVAGHALGAQWDGVHHAFAYVELALGAALAATIVAMVAFRRRRAR